MNRPWMPLNIADYLRDTSHLRAAESGAYLHLIMAYWVGGKLPSDDRQLATIAKLTDKEWRAMRPTLEAFFGEGFSSHKRIDKELAKVSEISNKRKAAVEQREIKRRSNDPSSDDTLNTQHITKEENKQDSGAVAPTAGRKKREKKYATALPENFEPNYEAATRANLSRREGEREFVKFKNHAAQTGRTCVNWQAAWANWCINAAQYLKRPPPGAAPNAAATITPASRSWNAWKAHFRDNNENVRASLMDKCADEGRPFTVSSEWPPGHEMNNAA